MKGVRIEYSQKELNWVKKHCTLTINELHSRFCELFDRVDVSKTNLNALRKRNGWLTGRTGQFKKGDKSWNKGLKGWDAGGKSSTTRFKKGQIPVNHKPIGSERICSKDGYVQIKTAEPKTWRLKHVVEWEKVNGKVPHGHKLWFIDNDRTNCDPKNLMLVTSAEHVITNTMKLGKVHPEFKKSVVLLAQIKMAEVRQRRAIKRKSA